MPFLSRIPILGRALQSSERKREQTELVLMITPRIIDESSALGTTLSEFADTLDLLDLRNTPSAGSSRDPAQR
jgi:type II secretory pathway component GspD/PulD (secretin)